MRCLQRIILIEATQLQVDKSQKSLTFDVWEMVFGNDKIELSKSKERKNMIDNYKIGNRIALLRREKGLTGESFAEKLGVSPQAVSKWENGKNLPETALLPAIAALLGTSIDSILIPQELVILDARYTCGDSYIVVTDIINRAVDSNKLRFKAECPIGGMSVEGSAVFVLTVKYQTPNGTYYAFVPQSETLELDLTSKGLTAKKGFEIVGAYYGIGGKYKSVMDKIQHDEYFKWNEIHVNHETFPSSPGVDESEYLTLVYMNSAGIHVVSCEENGILRYNDDKTGLYLKDTSSCILPGITPLSWGQNMDCCWGGSLYAALKYMGEPYTYEQIMGMSGACYRINFTEVWDWSATDALVAFDYSDILFNAIGYEQVWADRLDKDKRSSERKLIVSDIQMGKPVVAINLRVAAEWGVITGYADNGKTLYCRTYFDGDLLDENGKIKSNGDEYLETENWPFMLVHFGKKAERPADSEILKASLQALINSFRAPCERGYWQGEEAYKKWIDGLKNDSLWNLSNARDDFYRRASVNECTLRSLIDERRCAAVYLGECGQTELSEMYQGIYESVKSFHEKWIHRWDKVSNNGEEWRSEEICLLESVLQDEMKNVEIAKRILDSDKNNCRIEQLNAFELCGFSSVIKGGMTPSKFIKQSHNNGKLKKMYIDIGIETIPEDAPCTPNEPKSLYFALHDFKDDDTYSYMICHDIPKNGAPTGYETLTIPASTWAIFTSPEDIGADPSIQCTRAWNHAEEWLSSSEYEYTGGSKLEKGYNLGNMNFRYEVWIPVVKKQN